MNKKNHYIYTHHACCGPRHGERQDEAGQHGQNIHGRLCLVFNGGPQQGEVHPGGSGQTDGASRSRYQAVGQCYSVCNIPAMN